MTIIQIAVTDEVRTAVLRLDIHVLMAAAPHLIHEQSILSVAMVKEKQVKHVMITILHQEMVETTLALLKLGILAQVAAVPQLIHDQSILSEVMVREMELKHEMIAILRQMMVVTAHV
jgi:hypothetical protein